jgi:hypothetical protein
LLGIRVRRLSTTRHINVLALAVDRKRALSYINRGLISIYQASYFRLQFSRKFAYATYLLLLFVILMIMLITVHY